MDYTPIINAASAAAISAGLLFAGNFGRRLWVEVKASNRFQEMGFVKKQIAEIVVNSVADTWTESVRPYKEANPDQSMPLELKRGFELNAMTKVKTAAAEAGITEHLPNDSQLRGQVVAAVAEAKASAAPKLKAVMHTGPSTKGG